MKVGIITCHDVFNFGASLQAYALSQYIKNRNENVELINYKPSYMYRLIDLMEIEPVKWRANFLTRWMYRIYVFPEKLKLLKKYFAFRRFNREFLPISSNKYEKFDDLQGNANFDKVICGSDQIWNSNRYPCGEDPAFFLAFTEAEKIAYAASFGGNIISERGEENIKKYLPAFSSISVRERSGVDILKKYGLAAEHVLDPVFFLSGDDWRKIARKPKNTPQKYVIVYGYDNSAEFQELVEEFRGYTVLSIDSKLFRDAGPLEFIWLIDHAEMVITTSFHAVAFSITLHTPFITAITGTPELYERLEDIMTLCGLEERRYNILRQQENWKEKKIDYCAVDLALAESKKKSKHFLLSALGVDDDNE